MRLIDADVLEPHEQLEPMGNGEYEYVEVVYKDDIESLPSATSQNLAEPRTGHWFKNDDYICDQCGFHMVVGDGSYNFCPNCGADMRGEEE